MGIWEGSGKQRREKPKLNLTHSDFFSSYETEHPRLLVLVGPNDLLIVPLSLVCMSEGALRSALLRYLPGRPSLPEQKPKIISARKDSTLAGTFYITVSATSCVFHDQGRIFVNWRHNGDRPAGVWLAWHFSDYEAFKNLCRPPVTRIFATLIQPAFFLSLALSLLDCCLDISD